MPWKLGLLAVAALALTSLPPSKVASTVHVPPMLPRPELLTSLGAGYRNLIADYFWVETLQAVSLAQTPEEYRDIYDYAMTVADIDPRFRPVYWFAGATIPLHDLQHRWHNTKESTAILDLGAQRFPADVTLQILLAYNLATFSHEYARAATILTQAANLPGAPRYLPALATRLYSQAGQFDAGLAFAHSILDSTSDEDTRKTFEKRVKELELERILRALDSLLAQYREIQGAPARELNDLVRVGLLRGIPLDPLGGTIEIGQDGRSRSTAERHRLELFDEPKP